VMLMLMLDTSVKPDTKRVENTLKLLKYLVESTIRSDRECSTVDSCNELQVNVRKLLKGSNRREEVLHLLMWEPFTSTKPDKKFKKSKYFPQVPQQQYQQPQFQQFQQQIQPPSINIQQPQLQQPMGGGNIQTYQQPTIRLVCSFCGRYGHVENTCFTKHPELRKK